VIEQWLGASSTAILNGDFRKPTLVSFRKSGEHGKNTRATARPVRVLRSCPTSVLELCLLAMN
jgi:hypothetical protein